MLALGEEMLQHVASISPSHCHIFNPVIKSWKTNIKYCCSKHSSYTSPTLLWTMMIQTFQIPVWTQTQVTYSITDKSGFVIPLAAQ